MLTEAGTFIGLNLVPFQMFVQNYANVHAKRAVVQGALAKSQICSALQFVVALVFRGQLLTVNFQATIDSKIDYLSFLYEL